MSLSQGFIEPLEMERAIEITQLRARHDRDPSGQFVRDSDSQSRSNPEAFGDPGALRASG